MSSPTPPSSQTHRPDGRTSSSSLRPLSSSLSCLSNAAGSCHFYAGNTQIMASLFGPAPPKIPSAESIDGSTIGIVLKGFSRAVKEECNGMTEREVERWVHNALSATVDKKAYPRCVFQVTLSVIASDGSVLSALISAAVLALLDAGIQMISLPLATTCLISRHAINFDPTSDEQAMDDTATVVLTMDSVREGVIASVTHGHMSSSEYLACIEGADRAKQAMLAFFRIAMEQKTVREHKTLWTL